jgi:DNA replication protein DnaC
MSASGSLAGPLRSLLLTTMAREHEEVITRAEAQNWGYRRFLAYLVENEVNERLRRRIERQLKDSGLPPGKTLETLEEKKLPEKVRRQLPTLLSGELVRRGDNLLCFGLPGRGKSHLCAALGREWIQRHQLKVLFTPTFKLVTQLLAAKRDLKLPSALAKLDRFEVVILDDIGYVQQSREEMEVLFTFLAERYEKKSVVITSNLVFSQWDQIFKDPMTTMAAIDRLVHHATILEFNGDSHRAQSAKAKTSS